MIAFTLLTSYFLIPIYQRFIPSFYSVFAEQLYQPRGISVKMLLFSILGFALLPALGEECLFRGFLQSILNRLPFRKKSTQLFAVTAIVAILFAALHGLLLRFLINLPIAIVFSLLVIGTRSIFSSVIVHAIGNGFFTVFSTPLSQPRKIIKSTISISIIQ